MYSALKHAGKPLYEYARSGTDVVRIPRRVTVHALHVECYGGAELRIDVTCSKGTYIRVLAEDIGKALGCGATLGGLRRTRVGAFSVDDAVTLDALSSMTGDARSRYMKPVDALLAGLPALELDADQTQRIVRGQSVALQRTITGLVRVYGRGSGFLGVAEASPDGQLVARRLLSTGVVKA
jgi:tRNA pseudouridine55 synthase